MSRISIKIGDFFSVNVEDNKVRLFQYIGNDTCQLDSEVIRVFKAVFDYNQDYSLDYIAKGEVDWYAHCPLKIGIKLGVWTKIGKSVVLGEKKPLFRDTYDYGRAEWEKPVLISDKWIVWYMSEKFEQVGKLSSSNSAADIGLVMTPNDIVHRMIYGKYNMPFYPSY